MTRTGYNMTTEEALAVVESVHSFDIESYAARLRKEREDQENVIRFVFRPDTSLDHMDDLACQFIRDHQRYQHGDMIRLYEKVDLEALVIEEITDETPWYSDPEPPPKSFDYEIRKGSMKGSGFARSIGVVGFIRR